MPIWQIYLFLLLLLTSAYVAIVRFKPSLACAAADRNHPLSVSVAVELYWDVNFLWIGNADPSGNDQGGAFSSCHGLRKDCKVLDHTWALLIKDPDWQQRHAGTIVLKGQVEAIFRQWTKAPHLCVDLHQASSKVHLWEAFISSYGVHLEVRGLHPESGAFGGNNSISFIVVEIERLLAGARDVGDGAAVTHSESNLHVDALCSTPINEGGEEPVVLTGLKDITHLVGPDGVEVFIIATHFLPLQKEKEREEGEERAHGWLVITGNKAVVLFHFLIQNAEIGWATENLYTYQ